VRFRGKYACVVVAHADDETLGAGGLIQRLGKEGWKVRVVVMTRPTPAVHLQASRSAAEVLGVDRFEFLGWEDQRLDTVPVALLADDLSRVSADLYVTHAEVDLNADHRVVREAVLITARRAAATVLEMEVPGYAPWNGKAFTPNIYVALGWDEVSAKLNAWDCYVDAHHPSPYDPWAPGSLRALAMVRGSESDTPYAEAYRVVRGVI
jgi:LmbE family N-acetylglucosaminyl deacetylase